MKKPEILAPAGTMESLIAAIEAGCDAVYIGGYSFGARSFAGNFSLEEMKEAIEYAHIYGVKIYVTVNTICYESETSRFLDYIDYLVSINVDALIIQDLGMTDVIRKTYPKLELHASTQMNIHSIESLKFVKSLGIKRAVIAREISIDEIKEMKKNVDIELEVFAHGALCISYSGLCLMSSMIGGRSGNRGACAGSCRQKYSLIRKDNNNEEIIKDEAYLLSMKDLNTIFKIDELVDSKIDSLKIEGRMKRPSYVFAVVRLYKEVIDKYIETGIIEVNKDRLKDLEVMFSRIYTNGFLFNEDRTNITDTFRPNHKGIPVGVVTRVNGDFVTIKLSDKVSIHDGIRIIDKKDIGLNLNVFTNNNNIVKFASKNDEIVVKLHDRPSVGSKVVKTTDYSKIKEINDLIKEGKRKVNIECNIKIEINKSVILTVTDNINTVVVKSEKIVNKANSKPITNEMIKEKLNKLGNTVYIFNNIKIENNEDSFFPIGILNNLRREAIEELTKKRLYRKKLKKQQFEVEAPNVEIESGINLSVKDESLYKKVSKYPFDNIYYLSLNEEIDKKRVRYLPVMRKQLTIKDNSIIGELGSINKANNLIMDNTVPVVNSYTLAFLHNMGIKRVTLSYELTYEQIEELLDGYKNRYGKNPNVELVIYGKEEIMFTKNSFYKENHNLNNYYLKDRFNNNYPIIFYNDGMIIYNYKSRNLDILKYKKLGINTFRIQIINDSEIKEIHSIFN